MRKYLLTGGKVYHTLLISDKGAPRVILDLLSLKLSFLSGLTGQYNIAEIERNLEKKAPAIIPVYRKYFPEINLKSSLCLLL